MSSELLLCADACPEVVPVAARDPAIMSDRRVLEQLLRLEAYSVPSSDYFDANSPTSAHELQPYMRRVVTTWMLEVKKNIFDFLCVGLLTFFFCCKFCSFCFCTPVRLSDLR